MRLTIPLCLVLVFALPNVAMANNTVYKSSGEAIASIMIPSSGTSADQVLYSIYIPSIQAGSTVDLRFQAEVGEPSTACNIGIGRQIIMATSAMDTGVLQSDWVTQREMQNLTPDGEHLILTHTGVMWFTNTVTDVYFNVVIWGATDHSACQNVPIPVEQGYGELDAIVMSSTPPVYPGTQELVGTLPINGARQSVYSSGQITIPANSIVDVRFQGEVTEDGTQTNCVNVGIGRQLILSSSATGVTGTPLNMANMSNVTPDEHHEILVATSATYFATATTGYVNAVEYATATNCTGNVVVDGVQNNEGQYGQIQVIVRSAN